jgi:hypothetical protein
LSSVDRETVVPVWDGDPTFRSYLYVKLIQTDDTDEYHRIGDLVNAWGENHVLPTAVKIHNKPLINSHNLEVPDFRLDHVVSIIFVEGIGSL